MVKKVAQKLTLEIEKYSGNPFFFEFGVGMEGEREGDRERLERLRLHVTCGLDLK